jgi:hypothetical protein
MGGAWGRQEMRAEFRLGSMKETNQSAHLCVDEGTRLVLMDLTVSETYFGVFEFVSLAWDTDRWRAEASTAMKFCVR